MVLFLPLVLSCSLVFVASTAETASDLMAAESVASDSKSQAVATGSNSKYGYPYMIAPTLGPQIQARSDDADNEPQQAKPYGTRTSLKTEDVSQKKNPSKKAKVPYSTIRRQDENVSVERPFRSYKEPKYRNFEQLEDSFQPRRMDINIPYSDYDYKFLPKPSLSPRDPYLSPSKEPVEAFYPSSPKVKSYSSPSGYGTRTGGQHVYGAGHYEDPIHFHDMGHSTGYAGPSSYPSAGRPSSSYSSAGRPSASYPSAGPSSSYSSPGAPSNYPAAGSSPGYPSNGGAYGYQDYEIKSNEPIMGNIRKKLLDYAGASELYDGEPDYLQEISRNKHKYGSIGNDYYAYGGPGYRDSYREFPYVESKMSLIKKSRRV